MKKIFTLLSLGLVLCLFGCDDDEAEAGIEKLRYETNESATDTLKAFEYDGAGRLSKILYRPITKPYRYFQFRYGSDNRLIEKIEYNRRSNSDEFRLAITTSYTYLPDGKLAKEVITNPNSTRADKITDIIEYEYTGNLPVKTKEYTTAPWLADPYLQYSTSYEYNQAGKKIRAFEGSSTINSGSYIEYFYTDTLLTKALEIKVGLTDPANPLAPYAQFTWKYDSKNRVEFESFKALSLFDSRGSSTSRFIYK